MEIEPRSIKQGDALGVNVRRVERVGGPQRDLAPALGAQRHSRERHPGGVPAGLVEPIREGGLRRPN